MEETKSDALVECFWSKGSLIYKDKWSFDAILIKKAKLRVEPRVATGRNLRGSSP
jgi:hypothetical protein